MRWGNLGGEAGVRASGIRHASATQAHARRTVPDLRMPLLPVCIGLGYLFYRAVERPLMQHASTLFKASFAARAPSSAQRGSERTRASRSTEHGERIFDKRLRSQAPRFA